MNPFLRLIACHSLCRFERYISMAFWKRHLKNHIFNHPGFSRQLGTRITTQKSPWPTTIKKTKNMNSKLLLFFFFFGQNTCQFYVQRTIKVNHFSETFCVWNSVLMKCTHWQHHLFAFVLVPDPLKELCKPAQNSNNGLTNGLSLADQWQTMRCVLKTCAKRDTLLTLVEQKWHISLLIKHKKWMLVRCEDRSNGVQDKTSGEGLNNTVTKRHTALVICILI